jgi:hypothetical protein
LGRLDNEVTFVPPLRHNVYTVGNYSPEARNCNLNLPFFLNFFFLEFGRVTCTFNNFSFVFQMYKLAGIVDTYDDATGALNCSASQKSP